MAQRCLKSPSLEKDLIAPNKPNSQKDCKSISEVMLEFQAQTKKDMQEMKDFFQEKYSDLARRVREAMELLIERVQQIDEDYEILKQSHKTLEGKVAQLQEEALSDGLLAQYKVTEFAIRIRGLPENLKENLREIFAEFFAQLIGSDKKELLWQMDCVYRVNSWFAKQRNLPRDVVVYFTTRKLRNDILQASFNQKLNLLKKDIIIFKELPSRILTIRKGYKFLTEVLRSKQIRYRWAVPVGVMVDFQNKNYRLNTIAQAEEFYTDILKCGLPPSRIKELKLETINPELKELPNQEDSTSELDSGFALAEQEPKKKSKKKNKKRH